MHLVHATFLPILPSYLLVRFSMSHDPVLSAIQGLATQVKNLDLRINKLDLKINKLDRHMENEFAGQNKLLAQILGKLLRHEEHLSRHDEKFERVMEKLTKHDKQFSRILDMLGNHDELFVVHDTKIAQLREKCA